MALQIQTAPTGVVRDAHYVIPTGASEPVRTLLTEQQRTNVLLWSQDASQTAWVKTDTTVTTNAAIAPTGEATADLLVEGTAGTAAMHQNITVASGTAFSAARWLKRDNHDWVLLQIVDQAAPTTNFVRAWFNLATGERGAAATNGGVGATARAIIEPFGNGWYRCTVAGSLTGITAYRVVSQSANGDASTTRVNNARRLEFGRQGEAASAAPTSYIVTTGAGAIRNPDALHWSIASVVPQELTVYHRMVSVDAQANAGTAWRIVLGNSAMTGAFFRLGNLNANATAVYSDGTTPVTSTNVNSPAPVVGDIVETRAVLTADWRAHVHGSVNGNAEVSAAASSPSGPAAAFAAAQVSHTVTSFVCANATTHLGIFRGTRDRAYCRANTGVV